MAYGVVKWFDNEKGYGFIDLADDKGDIFVHFTGIDHDGFKTLKEGQEVSLTIVEGSRGLQATQVRVINGIDD